MKSERLDIRKLERAAREQLRRTVIRLFKRGHSQSAIARELGLRRSTVVEWVGKSKAGQSLQESRRGRPMGDGRRLTPAQEARLQKDLVDKTPDQLGSPQNSEKNRTLAALRNRIINSLRSVPQVSLYGNVMS